MPGVFLANMFNHTLAFKPDAFIGRDRLGATNKGLYIIFPGVTSSIQRANRKESWYTREKETVAEKESCCTSNSVCQQCLAQCHVNQKTKRRIQSNEMHHGLTLSTSQQPYFKTYTFGWRERTFKVLEIHLFLKIKSQQKPSHRGVQNTPSLLGKLQEWVWCMVCDVGGTVETVQI